MLTIYHGPSANPSQQEVSYLKDDNEYGALLTGNGDKALAVSTQTAADRLNRDAIIVPNQVSWATSLKAPGFSCPPPPNWLVYLAHFALTPIISSMARQDLAQARTAAMASFSFGSPSSSLAATQSSQLTAHAWQMCVVSGLIRARSFAEVPQTSQQSFHRCITLP